MTGDNANCHSLQNVVELMCDTQDLLPATANSAITHPAGGSQRPVINYSSQYSIPVSWTMQNYTKPYTELCSSQYNAMDTHTGIILSTVNNEIHATLVSVYVLC